MKVKPIERLTLHDMIRYPNYYDGLRAGLEQLPVPDALTVYIDIPQLGATKKKLLTIPRTMDELSESITYGQRLYFGRNEPNDYGIILRYAAGYFYPLATGKPWVDKNALQFGNVILHSKVIELFPIALHLVKLSGELVERELKLLKREPTRQEKAAGIDKLSIFSELTAVTFLCESFHCSESEVMQKPYNDCLVRFMHQKEQNAFAERLSDVYKKESETQKSKRK